MPGSLTPNNSHVAQCLRSNGYNTPSEIHYPTNGSMDGFAGGVFYVSDENKLLKAMQYDYANDIPFFITELIPETGIMRFFIDFDLQLKAPVRQLDDKAKLCFLETANQVVQRFYPSLARKRTDAFSMIVCDLSSWLQTQQAPSKKVIAPIVSVPITNMTLEERIKLEEEKNGLRELPAVAPTPAPAPAPQISKDGNMHVVFPNLYVNVEQWLILTQALQDEFARHIPRVRCIVNSATDIIDPSVINGSLRYLGSSKSKVCPNCHNHGCVNCNMLGKINQGRIYGVYAYYGSTPEGDNKIDEKKTAFLKSFYGEALMCTKLRPAPGTKPNPAFQVPPGTPAVDPEFAERVTRNHQALLRSGASSTRKFRKLEKTKQVVSFKSKEEKAALRRTNTEIPPNTKRGLIVLNLVHRFHTFFSSVVVRHISLNAKKNKYTVFVSGRGSTQCLNYIPSGHKKGHQSKRVYFQITLGGIVQRCTCKCDTTNGRRVGRCSDFVSDSQPLTHDDKRQLFPTVYVDPQKMTFGDYRSTPFGNNEATDKFMKHVKEEFKALPPMTLKRKKSKKPKKSKKSKKHKKHKRS